MKCKRVDLKADVQKYELGKGLEDGFELFSEIVTREWIVTDSLIRINREDGYIVSPFILNRRGREFIGVDDYIVIDEDGTKHVCGADKIWKRYQKIEEQEFINEKYIDKRVCFRLFFYENMRKEFVDFLS